jgi:hypothetical protein
MMRRSRRVTAAALAALLALGVAAGSAAAHGPCDDVNLDGTVTAREYAQFHISSHTPHGVGLEAHNPGTHQGFSLCLGVH